MWGLGVTDRKCCIVAPLFGADSIAVYPIVRDEATIHGMRQQAEIFWTHYVLAKVAPEPINLEDVDKLFKVESDTTVWAEPDTVERVLRYHAVDQEIDARISERNVLEFQIKRAMKDATLLQIPGQDKPCIKWANRKTAHLDQQGLKAEYPKLVKQFMREGVARVFTVQKGGLP